MDRRTLLAAVGSTVVATVGGCTGILEDSDGGGCSPPDTDDLTGLLPEGGGGFELDSDRSRQGTQATAFYTDSDGNRYFYSVFGLESASAASEKVGELGGDGNADVTIGYVRLGRYIFAVSTQNGDGDSVESLLATSSTLDEACVADNVEFV